MRDKGFTLIELLAVIVILAIIALIAVPIVVNIINDSKTSSDEQSVELYLDTVEKAITKKQLSNPSFNPDKCEIQDNGDLKCYKNNELIDTIQIEMKGKMPNKGEITILNNKFNYKNIWFNNKKYYVIATLLDDVDNNNEISIGDKYSYRVNDKDTFNFYVLTEPEDGKVNLIMDRNICEDGTTNYTENNNYCKYSWHYDGDSDWNNDVNKYGPDTAMTILYNATLDWVNVLNCNLEYDDINDQISAGYIESTTYGYKGMEITQGIGIIIKKDGLKSISLGTKDKPLKARLPKLSEVYSSTNSKLCQSTQGSCPVWLVDNLVPDSNYPLDIYPKKKNIQSDYYILGYWLLSSLLKEKGKAKVIQSNGRWMTNDTSYLGLFGIRPVITVPISDLE